ncbi:hypothetical protein C0993_012352 [Termitomyces sp. T159_Od127]|nr:hypothetical protein C0993_012352 [Termitomyces sp. T159_Od127]
MSDWTGVYSTVEAIKAGLDLEMPGPSPFRGKAVERSIVAEKLFPADIDARVRKVLELLKHAHASGIPFNGPEETFDSPEVRQTLRTAAADAIVLLKNEKKLLPLKNVKKLAVIGPNAKYAMTSGGGSARLRSASTVSPLEGITSAVKEFGGSVMYTIGATSHKYLPLLNPYVHQPNGQPGLSIEFWNEAPSTDYTSTIPDFSSSLKPAVWSTSTSDTNLFMMDGIVSTDFLSEAVKLAKEADAAILVIGLNHDWESEGFDRADMELPGLTNELVSQVLRANPNTVVVNQSGTPVTMPWIDQATTVLQGIFVGYRGFEAKKIAPLFPFGFGLSYTQFEYSNLVASDVLSNGAFTVTFSVKNIGGVRGREIAQIYITDEVSSLPRPAKELKAFTKVELQPGETKKVTLELDREALGFYDDRAAHWIAEDGKFKVLVAASSTDIRLTQDVVLKGVLTWNGL